jgi:aspartyl-tRNA synthetase
MGGMTFVDLRDRYGLTQLVFDESGDAALCEQANRLGREWCIQVTGTVSERQSKNPKMPTGDIEIMAEQLNVLSESQTPPFTIEDQTDGGAEYENKISQSNNCMFPFRDFFLRMRCKQRR